VTWRLSGRKGGWKGDPKAKGEANAERAGGGSCELKKRWMDEEELEKLFC